MRRQNQNYQSENGPIEDFSQLLYAMCNDDELLSQEYAKLLADLYDECYININPKFSEQMNEVYDEINYRLPESIKTGLNNEFEESHRILSNITQTLKEIAPFLVYSLPLDESANDVIDKAIDRAKRLPQKAKYGIGIGAFLGALGLAGHNDKIDYENHKDDVRKSYERYVEDMYELGYHKDDNGNFVRYEDEDFDDPEDTMAQMKKDLSKRVSDVKISKYGIDLIKNTEKFREEPYFPTQYEKNVYVANGGVNNVGMTIGYGHKINSADPEWLKTAKKITVKQAEDLLSKDIKERENTLRNFILNEVSPSLRNPSLYSQGFIDGMISFLYNCGGRSFRNSKTCQAWEMCRVENGEINYEDYEYLIDVLKGDKISCNGHTARRAEEAKFLSYR